MNVSVRELKNHLSEYLRQVAQGEEVTVTLRGRPVARLSQMPSENEMNPDAAVIARLEAQPWIRRGNGRKPRGARHPIPWRSGYLFNGPAGWHWNSVCGATTLLTSIGSDQTALLLGQGQM